MEQFTSLILHETFSKILTLYISDHQLAAHWANPVQDWIKKIELSERKYLVLPNIKSIEQKKQQQLIIG